MDAQTVVCLALCHELGNHLAAASLLGAEEPESMVQLSYQSTRSLTLLRAILDPYVQPGTSSVDALVRDIRLTLGDALDGEVEFRFDVPDDLPTVKTDAESLGRQIAHWMLDAMDVVGRDGQVRLKARLGEGCVVFEVADTGASIGSRPLEDEIPRGRVLRLHGLALLAPRWGFAIEWPEGDTNRLVIRVPTV